MTIHIHAAAPKNTMTEGKPGEPRPGVRAATLGLAFAGTGVFLFLGLPLPFLFGPMSACLLAALAGMPLRGLGVVSTAARTILGVAVGASVTPALVGQLPQMAASLALVPVYTAAIGLVGFPYFYKVCGFDPATSWYAAMPGGLQDMVIFGTEAGGDMRALSLIHATRVLIIVTVAPTVIALAFGISLTNPIGEPVSTLPVGELALMAVAAIVGWKVAERIGLFGASILGPMILAGILSLSGAIHSRPPAEAIQFAQFMIGIGIGVGYVGVTLYELKRDVLAAIVYVLFTALLAASFAELVVYLGLAPPLDAFLAYAPGGQAEMAVLAIVAGADLGFVIVHHVTRVLLVITGAPIAARLVRASGERR